MSIRFVHIHCYGLPLDERVDEKFADLAERFEYADNFRVAETSSSAELEEYERRREGGCCGSHDEEYLDEETGREFMIGCNYGH